ncbi:MAG TPA: LysR family transcriptional regulator [Alphaproteobacteria bacterium]
MAELDEIRTFVEVVETGGFGRAAKRLGVSKSIVSRRIASLEADLGTRLLSRTTRGISPTEAGLELKARGERILTDLAEARELVANRGGEVIGHLRLSLPLTFGVRHVAPLLAELAARHPKLEIEAHYTDRAVDLIAEHYDAAVRIGQLADSSLIARKIAPTGGVVVASPAYLAARGEPATPEDLAAHECLVHVGSPQRETWRFRDGKRWITVRPKGRIKADNGEAILEHAVAGAGIALLPTFLMSGQINDRKLKPLLLRYELPEAAVYLVRPPGPHVPAKLRALIDALVAHFDSRPDWDPCQVRATAARKLMGEGRAAEQIPQG